MKTTGAEAIVAFWKHMDVRYLFGLMGSPMFPTMDALYRAGDIKFIPSQHEQGAIYMAMGYAKCTRQPGVCFVTVGPGATNATSGVAESYIESIPVVFMAMRHTNLVYGRPFSNSHEIDQLSVFRPITKGAWEIERADRIVEILERAFRTAQSGRPGPVYVGISREIQDEEVEVKLHPRESFISQCRLAPDENSLKKAVDVLVQSQNPILLSGGGIWGSDAQAELIELAERLEAPMAVAFAHGGLVPETHPLAVGRPEIGTYRRDNSLYNALIDEADLLVALGTTMSDRTTSKYHPQIVPPGIDILQVDIDPLEIGKNYPVKIGLVGDLKATLQLMLRELDARGISRKDLSSSAKARRVQELKHIQRERFLPQALSDAVPIKRLRLMKEVFDFFGPDAIINGSHGWKERVGDLTQVTLAEGGDYGTASGSGFCRSLAVKLAYPHKQVVWLGGDGAFMMVLSELATAVAQNIGVITIINHNSAYGNEKVSQAKRYGGRFIGTELPIPDLAAVAKAFGAHGERVERPEQIRGALERAVASKKPALLDVILGTSVEELDPHS